VCLCLCSCVCSCVCVHVFVCVCVCVCVFQRREKREEERGEMRDKEKKMEIDLKKKTLFTHTHTHILSFTRTHILSSHSCSLSFPCLSFDRLSSRVRIKGPCGARGRKTGRLLARARARKKDIPRTENAATMVLFLATTVWQHLQFRRCGNSPLNARRRQ
jgi:hypothetical protein